MSPNHTPVPSLRTNRIPRLLATSTSSLLAAAAWVMALLTMALMATALLPGTAHAQLPVDTSDPAAPQASCPDCPVLVLPGAGSNWQAGGLPTDGWQPGQPRPLRTCTVVQVPTTRSFRGNIWPGGVVPYQFANNVNQSEQSAVLAAMAEWEAVSPVTFVPRTNQSNHIFIQDANVNSSAVGQVGGRQTINIFNFNVRMIICHELCHALGFFHTQSRPDRNTYVTIQSQNIVGGALFNFNIAAGTTTQSLPYDFLSIMHYGDFAFSANGQPTILCNPGFTQFQTQIGQRSQLSTGDIAMMQAAYGPITAPTLTGLSPSSGESYLPPRVSLFGTELDTINSVTVGGVPAAYAIISDTQVDITPPNPAPIGNTTIEVSNGAGPSNTVAYTVTGNSPPRLTGTTNLLRGLSLPFRCHTEPGKAGILFVSPFNGPSVAPGVASLDIGSNFSFLLEVGAFGIPDATGTITWTVPVPASVPQGLVLYLQAVVFDVGNITYPVDTTVDVVQATVIL